MPQKVIVDSGPHIALFDKDDSYHRQALEFTKDFKGKLASNLSFIA